MSEFESLSIGAELLERAQLCDDSRETRLTVSTASNVKSTRMLLRTNGNNRVVTFDDSGLPKCRDPVANMETLTRERDREVRDRPEEAGTDAGSVYLTLATPVAIKGNTQCAEQQKLEEVLSL